MDRSVDFVRSLRFCLCGKKLGNDWFNYSKAIDFKLSLPTFSRSARSMFRLSVNLPESVRNGTMNAIFFDYMKTCIEPSVFYN